MLGNIIEAGSNIVAGILGGNEKDKDRKLQKEFAQQGIQWKVADAKAAGIHPLAALGAQTTSFSPVSVGEPSLASGLASAGQDISRAVDATRNQTQKVDAYTKTVQDLNVRRMGLENELLASQIAKVNQAGVSPALPGATDQYLLEGQGNSPLVTNSPLERTVGARGAPFQEPGAIPDVGFSRTATGYHPVYSKDVKDRLEEDFVGSILWSLRNRLAPSFEHGSQNPPAFTGEGNGYWIYSPTAQEYRWVTRKPRQRGFSGGFERWYQ